MADAIPAAFAWPTNAELIADVAEVGYLRKDWLTLDVTYGRGKFWTKFCPDELVTHDLATDGVDFRDLPHLADAFDVTVMDPPYKLNGTPALGDMDDRYGTGKAHDWREKMQMIREGIAECIRVTWPSGYFLLKCQDQVCSGAVRWQTHDFAELAGSRGAELVDGFIHLGAGRPQPAGRRQVHARRNYSTLLVFQVG